MQKSKLSQIFDIQKLLQDLEYPDYKRISLEIIELIDTKRIKREEIFARLNNHEPWEYIRGYCEFCGLNFIVSKDTLIPRIETEQIVYNVLDILKKEDITNIVDVGTGTGCIPISIAKLCNLPHSIYATDISHNALKIAKENEKNLLQTNYIHWIETDLISDLNIDGSTLFTINLPYIPTKQYEKLDKSVRNFEPRLALDGGKNGLIQYEKFFKQSILKNINTKYIILETEETIFNNTIDLVRKYFKDTNISKLKDIYGKNRFLLISFH